MNDGFGEPSDLPIDIGQDWQGLPRAAPWLRKASGDLEHRDSTIAALEAVKQRP